MKLLIIKSKFAGYISAAVSQGPGCLSLRCPDPSCSAIVLQGMINKLGKHEDKEKYARFALRAYVESRKKVSCSHNYLEGYSCLYFILADTLAILILCTFYVTPLCNLNFSCRRNGVQLLTVYVQWNLLVM